MRSVYATEVLPFAPDNLTKHYDYLEKFLSAAHALSNCYRKRNIRVQFVTVSAAFSNNLLPHTLRALTICCRMRVMC